MSVFSEQNARLAQGLVAAKAAIEAKKGTVTVANATPQIEEIVAGISTVKAGSSDAFQLTSCNILVTPCIGLALPQGGLNWYDRVRASSLIGYPAGYRVVDILEVPVTIPTFVWSDAAIQQINP